jgi:tetratricopeptide (TPR) repeat protein
LAPLHATEVPNKSAEELIRKGNRLVLGGEFQAATQVYKKAMEDYQSTDAVLNLAIVYDHYLNFERKAVIFYREFLRLRPNNFDKEKILKRIALIEEGKTKTETTERSSMALKYTIEAPKTDPYTREGNLALKSLKFELAINKYQRAIVMNNSAVACYNLALVYDFDLKFYTRAIYFYQKYLALDPENKVAGDVAKRIEAAREALKQSMAIAPKSHLPLLGPK